MVFHIVTQSQIPKSDTQSQVCALAEYNFQNEPNHDSWVNVTWTLVTYIIQLTSECRGLPWGCSGLGGCLPMKGSQVWSLLREDPTGNWVTKPEHRNYWPTCWEPVLWSQGSRRVRSPCTRTESRRPAAPTAARESPHAATKTQHS